MSSNATNGDGKLARNDEMDSKPKVTPSSFAYFSHGHRGRSPRGFRGRSFHPQTSVPPVGGASGQPIHEPFKIERVMKDDAEVAYVQFLDQNLLATMLQFVQIEELYGVNPKVAAYELFLFLPELQKYVNPTDQKRQKEKFGSKKSDERSDSKSTQKLSDDNDKAQVEKEGSAILPKTEPMGEENTLDPASDGNLSLADQCNDSSYPQNSPMEKLVDWLEEEFDSTIKLLQNMTNKGDITFDYLWYLYPKKTEIYAEWHDRIVGSRVTKAEYRKDFLGNRYSLITGEIIDSDGNNFNRGIKQWRIPEFTGTKKIKELPVIPLDKNPDLRAELEKRGRLFAQFALGPHYLRYTGKFFRQTWFGPIYFKGDGRIMVDTASFTQMNPSYDMGPAAKFNRSNPPFGHLHNLMDNSNSVSQKEVKEEEYFMCAPTLFGFSFTAKKWGQLYIDQFSDIIFDDGAFDQLVMDPIKKDIIISLVKSELTKLDLISGKGGGCIFLLHGPPGVGKTLTAEAISEYLHRPLYAVSVGELGTTTKDLEQKLSEVLEVANVWNAVILIDEADIFLEQRSEHDIHRNALVAIFLRLLEYHQGVLFLTTNRVKCFDKAFNSRISVSFKYQELDANARTQVWQTFLDRADGEGKSQVNIEKLVQRALNGREIKTAVRLAKALATKTDTNAVITTSHLESILDISKSFIDELESEVH